MGEDKIRLGGMALANGVLVHGPTAWACAIRASSGELVVESDYKRFRAAEIERPLIRGAARLAEVMLLLPEVRGRLPQARLPFERPRVLGAMVGSVIAARLIKTSRLKPFAQELLAGILSLAPAALSVRGTDVAAYHGAEHISIGSYEHGEAREKEHERCGSHIVGPLILSSAVGGALAAKAPANLQGPARVAAQLGAVGVATELFAWMVRHPDSTLARALAKPGHELQHRLATEDPTPEQLEVAEAALAACLALEQRGDRRTH
jgi:uncharacterized protein YqhQ